MTEFETQVIKLLEDIVLLLEVKWLDLPDGAVYLYTKAEDIDAIRKQTPPIQEGIPTTEGTK
jgi:hypothetical protein